MRKKSFMSALRQCTGNVDPVRPPGGNQRRNQSHAHCGGHDPQFPGLDQFNGQVVHPQQWPANLDYGNKRVVVVGSGATAVTLVPAMAGRAAHVTMLQRSPTYIVSIPGKDAIANGLNMVKADGFRYEASLFGVLFATADQKEGMGAFVDKRKAAFKGK